MLFFSAIGELMPQVIYFFLSLTVTKKYMAGEKENSGPPFSAMNPWPSSSNVATVTVPLGPGPAFPYRAMFTILEFLKIERFNCFFSVIIEPQKWSDFLHGEVLIYIIKMICFKS
jgi:hypothetical protein